MGWSELSPQTKVFAVVHVLSMVSEFVGEIWLSNLIPDENKTMKTRFWSQYLVGATMAILVGVIGHVSIECMAKSGWNKLAWAAAIIPSLTLASGGYMLHGVDAILGSSSGTGSAALIKTALIAKKKKSVAK